MSSNIEARKQVFKSFTQDLAKLSKCEERKVAAIITDSEMTQVYSIGINGGPKGLADCMCAIDGKYGCVHAEVNALIKCQTTAPGKIMFVTLAPCKQCAASIINAPGGFSKVYYFEEWKEPYGINLMRAAGIQVERI